MKINHGNNSKENEVEKVEMVNTVDVSIGKNSKENTQDENAKDENRTDKKNELSNNQKNELKEYLSSVYEVTEDKIVIN